MTCDGIEPSHKLLLSKQYFLMLTKDKQSDFVTDV